MFAENVGSAGRFGAAQTHAGHGQSSLAAIYFTVDTLFDALGDGGFHLFCGGQSFPQAAQTQFPLGQLGVAQHRVLNDLIALVFDTQVADRNVGLRSVDEVAQCRIDERGLCADVEKRRSGALEAERKTIGPANPSAGGQLRDVAIAQFTVAGGSVLLLGRSDADTGGVLQCEFHRMAERDGFSQQRRWQEEHRQ